MTTPSCTDRVAVVVDDLGPLSRPLTATQLAAALRRHECVPTDRPDVFMLVARPMRQLTPAERRALVLKAAKR